MNNKQKKSSSPLVYSTDPNFMAPGYDDDDDLPKVPANQQKIKVLTSTKHRAGKVVTLITNLIDGEEEKEKIAKQLKTFCGTGGSYKEGEIIIQGDHKDKVLQWLQKQGYSLAKKV